jgi:hypothetical protein
MGKGFEVVRRDEPEHRQVHVGKVVARTGADDVSGDRARGIARQFHGARRPGASHWYEVREAGKTGTSK